ncbi:MAG TPA: M28 family metallopeptidase [Allosphingosinicella sp.]|uniref:M28 family metallopeptidase n=1 Tax=Allosphingosinicella sp. TaxID=2823234 RepID=UPI002ED9493A
MRLSFPLVLIPFLSACATVPPLTPEQRAGLWWQDVSVLAADDMEGRLTGTPGYQRAADYVVRQAAAAGLKPAGDNGYFQSVAFEEQSVASEQSSAALVAGGAASPLRIPQDIIISTRSGTRPQRVEAPLVFLGYGLHLPEAGHDDFAGIDLKGKIAVVVGGGPADISGALKSHARGERLRLLEERGAVGVITLTTPKAVEVPWSRSMAQVTQTGMYFADPSIRDLKSDFFFASFNPEETEKLFVRSGRSFAEIAALSDASKAVPRFELNQSLRASVVSSRKLVSSNNVVAMLPGNDPALRNEYVVLSAHLDHLGMSAPINGDPLYNGALDNAAGVSTLLDIARTLQSRRVRPKRSILFVFVTAEEKGLLGSSYFAQRPTVPNGSIVANLNFDMALPIFPLRSVIALGAEESSLGGAAAEVGQSMGLPLVPDPFPERNSFTRSDQYSFIRQGIPALAFKFGFAKDTPEAEIERKWRSTHYHAPSDDLSQPVAREDAIRLNDFVAELTLRVADAAERPQWLQQSFFRRFAKN